MTALNLPNNELSKAYYQEKIEKYKGECGCKMGTIFSALALLVLLGYEINLIFVNPAILGEFIYLFKINIYGIGFIFISTGMGKLIGIAIARIKLKRIYKSLQTD